MIEHTASDALAIAGPEGVEIDPAEDIANDPTVTELCQKLSDFRGGNPPDTVEMRRNLAGVGTKTKVIEYLKGQVQKAKKETQPAIAADKPAAGPVAKGPTQTTTTSQNGPVPELVAQAAANKQQHPIAGAAPNLF